MRRLGIGALIAVIALAMADVSVSAPAAKDEGTSGDAPRMTKEELESMLGNPDLVIIDCLVGDQWKTVNQKLPGAVHEDPDNVDAWADKYSKDKIIVTVCA